MALRHHTTLWNHDILLEPRQIGEIREFIVAPNKLIARGRDTVASIDTLVAMARAVWNRDGEGAAFERNELVISSYVNWAPQDEHGNVNFDVYIKVTRI